MAEGPLDPRHAPGAVAVVGMAALFPGAPDLATYWHNVLGRVDAITDAPASRWDPAYYDPAAVGAAAADRFYCRRGGFVETAVFDPARYGVMPVAVETAEPDQLLALQVAGDAVEDAGGLDRLGDRSRVGVVVGRGGYLTPGVARLDQRVRTAHQLVATLRELLPEVADDRLDEVRRAFQARLGPARPESSIGLVPNLAASRVANRLDLQGPAYTVDAACASSLVAVDHAVHDLASGRCDAVIAGGVHHCHDVTLWSVFTQLGALSPSQRIRPFHREADGILVGEGTGMVVLKRLVDAERDGDRVYAVIRGTGVASDGRASSLMSPRADGQVLALQRAWRAAGLDPTEAGSLGLLEAHGTATPAGDGTELDSLTRVFGPGSAGGDRSGPPDIGIGSVKSMIGHAMPAAGVAGLIKAALAVYHGVLPPTLHCDDPHPALAGTRFRPVTEAVPWPERSGTPRRAGVDAFGFGGINSHVVLEQAPGTVASPAFALQPSAPARSGRPAPQAGEPAPERVLLLAGASPADLAAALAADDDVLLARDDSLDRPDGGPCRLAVVAPTRRRLDLARRVLAQGRPWRGRNDVWFTREPLLGGPAGSGGKVAFLYPGLEQTFDPRVDDVAAHFGLPRPDLGDADVLGRHGLHVIAVGRLLTAALDRLGIGPDLLAGHSVGEWTAMIVAGCYPPDAVDAFVHTFDPDELQVPGVVFAALGCGAVTAGAVVDELDGVVVSHDNCPHQSIICGEEDVVATALARLAAHGVTGQVLPFRSGFHSPMLAPYLDPMRVTFDRLPLLAPAVPLWSATTVDRYPADLTALRQLVVRHLVEPVRFGPLVARLHDEGVRAFVQVGTGSLPGFVDDALHGREHVAVTANAPKRTGLEQLRRVAAALWVEGLAPRFDRLPTAARRETVTATAPPTRRGVELNLGSALVRLDGAVPPLVPSRPSAPLSVPATGPEPPVLPGSADHPVLAEFEALLREARAAAQDVLGGLQRAAPASPPPPPVPAPVPVPVPAPVQPAEAQVPPAREVHPAPGPGVETRTLSLAAMPYLTDHCLYRQPPGWPHDADRYPVVPLTTTLELMMDAARQAAPGRTVVGIRDVRALRWLAVAPPVDVTVRTSLDADGDVRVVLDGYARGTVLLAAEFPDPPVPGPARPLAGERAPDVTAERLYTDRWMFHGPAFQGVRELTAIGEDGIRGVLAAPATPGALLDNAGQLMGFWVMRQAVRDRLALPSGVDRVLLFGPPPVPGERVGCEVRIRELTDRDVVADLELRGASGRLWCRVEGWRDRRFASDEVSWPVYCFPEENLLAETRPGGWLLVRERWPDSASRELMMRRYLGTAERAAYAGRNARAQRQWLLGRIAVKDAVRRLYWDGGGGPLYPVEVEVRADELGRPEVSGPVPPLAVSLAHTGQVAVATVAPLQPGERLATRPGIDIEQVRDLDERNERTMLTAAERTLLDQVAADGERAAWVLRFWTAKEAVGKAAGTGLAGRPSRWVVERVDGERLLVRVDDPEAGTGRRWVRTVLEPDPAGGAPFAVAWTEPAQPTPTPTPVPARDRPGASDVPAADPPPRPYLADAPTAPPHPHGGTAHAR